MAQPHGPSRQRPNRDDPGDRTGTRIHHTLTAELDIEGEYDLTASRGLRPAPVVAVFITLLALALVVYVILWGTRPAYDPWWPVLNR